jgi:DsbC/DsbD-like thiol-disulfide interchange protein
MSRHTLCTLACVLLTAAGASALALKSDSKVKVTATADKPGSDGKQVVTVTLDIDNGWHAYANPVGSSDFPGLPTTVTITAGQKPEKVTVEYPKGKMMKDDVSGAYFVYEGKTTIKAVVQRAKGDTSPLDVAVRVQACNDKSCLQPATVKLTVK